MVTDSLVPTKNGYQSIERSDSTLTAKEAILHPPRLEALGACDVPVFTYHRYSLLRDFQQCRGRNSGMLMMPLLLLALWGTCWQLAFLSDDADGGDMREEIQSMDYVINTLAVPVAFLIVFRLSRAAVRFWDSSAATGTLIHTCRSNISMVAVALKAPGRHAMSGMMKNGKERDSFKLQDDLLDRYARWLAAFPVAVKNFLRSKMDASAKGWDESQFHEYHLREVSGLLSADEAHMLLAAEHPVLLVMDCLREIAYDICVAGDQTAKAELYIQINAQLDALSGAFGTLERISLTPLPFVYVSYLRTFLLLYLLLVNMVSVARYGWEALLLLAAINGALLGIEAASVECERPFGWSLNHLPLAKFCIVIAENIAQTLDETDFSERAPQLEQRQRTQ